MISRGRHPKNAINHALDDLDTARFEVVEVHRGHRWGAVGCQECGMSLAIWSTPRVPENPAAAIARFARHHHH